MSNQVRSSTVARNAKLAPVLMLLANCAVTHADPEDQEQFVGGKADEMSGATEIAFEYVLEQAAPDVLEADTTVSDHIRHGATRHLFWSEPGAYRAVFLIETGLLPWFIGKCRFEVLVSEAGEVLPRVETFLPNGDLVSTYETRGWRCEEDPDFGGGV